ncbi:MAG: flagellar basal body rod protein FlgB, partial [Aliihoeflea sp.]
MQPVNLFSLASEQAKWLSVRQAAVSGNIANVHT